MNATWSDALSVLLSIAAIVVPLLVAWRLLGAAERPPPRHNRPMPIDAAPAPPRRPRRP